MKNPVSSEVVQFCLDSPLSLIGEGLTRNKSASQIYSRPAPINTNTNTNNATTTTTTTCLGITVVRGESPKFCFFFAGNKGY